MFVSQNISNNESSGSVSYIAKKGFIGAAVKTPICLDVDNLPIKGLVSSWYKLAIPIALKLSIDMFESSDVAMLTAVSVNIPGKNCIFVVAELFCTLPCN